MVTTLRFRIIRNKACLRQECSETTMTDMTTHLTSYVMNGIVQQTEL